MPTENRSSNTEMVSVPRDLAEEINSALYDHDLNGLTVRLQELLDKPADQHQGEPVMTWRDMETAPRDGTIIRLLVRFTENATEDEGYKVGSPTIGSNSFDDTGEDLWQFAGWSWEQDCYTQGEGAPIGWLPMLGETPADTAEVERAPECFCVEHGLHIETLRAQLAERDALLDRLRNHLIAKDVLGNFGPELFQILNIEAPERASRMNS